MKPLIALIVISMALTGRVSAQSTSDVSAKNLVAYTANAENVVDAPAVAVSKIASEVKISERNVMAERSLMADSMQAATAKLVADHAAGSTELLRSGSDLELSTTMGSVHNALEQHSVTVHVTYDARPVGGILNIRVELVPVFGGIGSAVRPTISREFAQAVENFDDDFISDTIMKLTNDLAAELAANQ